MVPAADIDADKALIGAVGPLMQNASLTAAADGAYLSDHNNRARANSYHSGLAALSSRLAQYTTGTDGGGTPMSMNDPLHLHSSISSGVDMGGSSSSGLVLEGHDKSSANLVNNPGMSGGAASTATARSKAETAMEKIRNKRAGGNIDRNGIRLEQCSVGCQTTTTTTTMRRIRKRSHSEPAPLNRTLSVVVKTSKEDQKVEAVKPIGPDRRDSAESTSSLHFEEINNVEKPVVDTYTPPPRGTNGMIVDSIEESNSVDRVEMESRALTQNFVIEHRIFLRAVFQLLDERDQFAVEADANDPHTIKTGPLKKATSLVRGVWKWKVKYVEVRRGLFSYYENTTETGTSLSLPKRRSSIEADPDAVAAVSSIEDDGGEDSGNVSSPDDSLRRKSIPLRAATCTCRAVKVQNKALAHTPLSPNGAVFELTVEGGPRRLFMCNTREERLAWIHAIHEAMIGASVTRGDNFLEYQVERKRGGGSNSAMAAVPMRSPYRLDLEQYLSLQAQLKNAENRDIYMGALAELYETGHSLNVPVQWIKERIEVASASSAPSQFHEGGLSSGVAQLWKDMLRDSISINGTVYKGDKAHGPECIVGALSRCILSFDKSATQNVNATRAYRKKFCITESQAVSYARDVLLACNRTRSGGDSYYCMDTLCSNPELVVLCPSSSEADPLRIIVRHSANNDSSRRGSTAHGYHDISGWILTRSGPNKSWKKRFGVLSEGVLSYYEQAHPRPNGLRGQLLLAGATVGVSQVGSHDAEASKIDEVSPKSNSQKNTFSRISTSKTRYIVCIISKDRSKERQIVFDDQHDFFLWNQSFRDAIKMSETSARGGRVNGSRSSSVFASSKSASAMIANKIRGLSVRARDGGTGFSGAIGRSRFARSPEKELAGDGASESANDDDDDDDDYDYGSKEEEDEQGQTSTNIPTTDTGVNTSDVASTRHPSSMRGSKVGCWKKVKGGRARSSVEISVQNTAVYKICDIDPQGDDAEDTWAMLRTNFLQNFHLSGGPNGRILRGEEIVKLDFLKGLVEKDSFDRIYTLN